MNRALIIRQPWVHLILSGQKTWEMRSRATKIRGTIGIISQGTGTIVGQVDLVGCVYVHGTGFDSFQHSAFRHHLITDAVMLRKYPYAWVMENHIAYREPIPYGHPKGAVTWVKINSEVT